MVGVGIIGIGGMGRGHARYLAAGEWGDRVRRFPSADDLFASRAVDAVAGFALPPDPSSTPPSRSAVEH